MTALSINTTKYLVFTKVLHATTRLVHHQAYKMCKVMSVVCRNYHFVELDIMTFLYTVE
jgi:hypothetical protein